MVKFAVASVGLFAASVSALGSAVVVNQCSYDVYLADVPAVGGGYQQSEHTLHSGDSWSQQWTALSNNNGWSIKLSQEVASTNIMQYEYTFQSNSPDIIWYDLSDVNGNPWNNNWEVNADNDNCDPKEQAYRYATDDAYGEQSCPSDATITVTLCSSSGSSNSSASAPASSADAAAPAPVLATTVAAPSFSAPATTAQAPVSVAQVSAALVSAASVSVAQVSQAPVVTSIATTTVVAAQPAATTAVVSVLPQPFGALGLGVDGAVIEESDVVPGLRNAGRDAAAAPSLTTFATYVSAATDAPASTAAVVEDVIPIAGRLARRHEHASPRHHHHHAA